MTRPACRVPWSKRLNATDPGLRVSTLPRRLPRPRPLRPGGSRGSRGALFRDGRKRVGGTGGAGVSLENYFAD